MLSTRRTRQTRTAARALSAALEPLERRELFAVDLLPFMDYITLGDKPALIPGSILQGSTTAVTIPMIVQNSGSSTEAVPAGKSIGIQVFARPSGAPDASQDILVNKSAVTLAIGGLGISAQKKVNVSLNTSALPAGAYDVILKIDPTNTVTETDEDNNTKLATNITLDIDPASSDLAAFINAKTVLPAGNLISDGLRKIPVKLDINNIGNTATPGPTKVNVAFTAHRTSDNADIPLQTFANVALGAVQPHKGKTITFNPILPFGMEAGTYTITATVTSAIPTDDAGNNTATTVGTITVVQGFYDLAIDLVSTTLPNNIVQGTAPSGTLKVQIANLGNVALPKTAKADFLIRLRPDGTNDNLNDVDIGDILNVSVAGLAPNKPKPVTLKIAAPTNPLAPAGSFFVIGGITLDGGLPDLNQANNVSVSPEGFIVIGPANPDLTLITASNFTPTTTTGGIGGTATVTVKNQGTANSTGGYTVTYYASTSNVLDNTAIALGSTVTPTDLGIGKTATVKLLLAFPNPDTTTTYNIFAKITAPGTADANTANNATTAFDSIQVTHADLAFAPAIGQAFTFKSSQHVGAGAFVQENGTFKTNTGATGTYNMTIISGNTTVAVLFDNAALYGPGFGMTPTFTGTPFTFGGKTLSFSHDSAGAKAQFQFLGDTVYFK